MNVVSLVILLVSAGCVEVLEGVGVAAPLDIVGAQVMVEGKVALLLGVKMREMHWLII